MTRFSTPSVGLTPSPIGIRTPESGANPMVGQPVRIAGSGGYLPLAPGVSTVRYPIPERIFDYVSKVRSEMAGACQKRKSKSDQSE